MQLSKQAYYHSSQVNALVPSVAAPPAPDQLGTYMADLQVQMQQFFSGAMSDNLSLHVESISWFSAFSSFSLLINYILVQQPNSILEGLSLCLLLSGISSKSSA